ncbi:hypothetical protein FISHEDRAFT_38592, partial [Fistulina hepatica ATCC 64428]
AIQALKQIRLSQVPRSATLADIRRALLSVGAQGIVDVSIVYDRFRATGEAIVTCHRANQVMENLGLIKRLGVFGQTISAQPCSESNARSRGGVNYEVNAYRNLYFRDGQYYNPSHFGNGTNGGILERERKVVAWGFPPTFNEDDIMAWVKDYKLARLDKGKVDLTRLALTDGLPSSMSKWVIGLSSPAEAHRLVRDIHMRPILRAAQKQIGFIRAQIIY